jgi:hypothetical protein
MKLKKTYKSKEKLSNSTFIGIAKTFKLPPILFVDFLGR